MLYPVDDGIDGLIIVIERVIVRDMTLFGEYNYGSPVNVTEVKGDPYYGAKKWMLRESVVAKVGADFAMVESVIIAKLVVKVGIYKIERMGSRWCRAECVHHVCKCVKNGVIHPSWITLKRKASQGGTWDRGWREEWTEVVGDCRVLCIALKG